MTTVDKSKQLKIVREHLITALPQIKKDIPKGLDSEMICKSAMIEFRKNEGLQKCDPVSFISAVLQATQLGLQIGSNLGQSYLIPFFNSKKKVSECQFIVGYRGMLELARRSGQIHSINAQVVYENDLFELEYGLNEKLKHVPTFDEDRGKFIGAYAVAKLKDGSHQFKFLPAYKIEALKEQQLGKIKNEYARKYSPWVTSFEEMSCKTTIRRLFKFLPSSLDLDEKVRKAIVLDEAADVAEQNNNEFDINTGELKEINVKRLNDDKMKDVFGKKEQSKSIDEVESTGEFLKNKFMTNNNEAQK